MTNVGSKQGPCREHEPGLSEHQNDKPIQANGPGILPLQYNGWLWRCRKYHRPLSAAAGRGRCCPHTPDDTRSPRDAARGSSSSQPGSQSAPPHHPTPPYPPGYIDSWGSSEQQQQQLVAEQTTRPTTGSRRCPSSSSSNRKPRQQRPWRQWCGCQDMKTLDRDTSWESAWATSRTFVPETRSVTLFLVLDQPLLSPSRSATQADVIDGYI